MLSEVTRYIDAKELLSEADEARCEDDDHERIVTAVTKTIDERLTILGPGAPAIDDRPSLNISRLRSSVPARRRP